MIESWKARLNNGTKFGGIIMDLSKVFDSLNHNLLLSKFKAYGVDNNPVEFFCSYIFSSHQSSKINNSFSQWKKVLARVPQDSILWPLLFNNFINDIFRLLQIPEFAKYADDTMYLSVKNTTNVKILLNQNSYQTGFMKTLWSPILINAHLHFWA